MAVANAPTIVSPHLNSPDLKSPDLPTLLSGYLTNSEVAQITQQMLSTWVRNKQVFWTGNLRQQASEWANDRKMTTLSTALGPLRRDNNPSIREKEKLSKYMKGASALFAWFATADDFVTVVCHPPPDQFNPEGHTTFQLVEFPILIGILGGRAVPKIDFVHPTVSRADSFTYQFWPNDESDEWERRYAKEPKPKVTWQTRAVTSQTLQLENVLRQLLTGLEQVSILRIILPGGITGATRKPPANEKGNVKHVQCAAQMSTQKKTSVKKAKAKPIVSEPVPVSNGSPSRKSSKDNSQLSTAITTSKTQSSGGKNTKKAKGKAKISSMAVAESQSQPRTKTTLATAGEARRGCSISPKGATKDPCKSQGKEKKKKKSKKAQSTNSVRLNAAPSKDTMQTVATMESTTSTGRAVGCAGVQRNAPKSKAKPRNKP